MPCSFSLESSPFSRDESWIVKRAVKKGLCSQTVCLVGVLQKRNFLCFLQCLHWYLLADTKCHVKSTTSLLSANTLLEAVHISTHPFDWIQFVLHSNFLGWFQLASCSLLPVLFLTVIHRVLLEKSALCHDAALLKIYCLCVALYLLGLSPQMPAMFLPTDYP